MPDELLTGIGVLCMFASFTTPLYIIPIFWKKITGSKTRKFFLGLLIALGLSVVLFITSFFVVFRNGFAWR